MQQGASFTNGAARLAGQVGWLLHWPPETFWRATPAELGAVLSAATGGADAVPAAPDRDVIGKLQEMFPDG